MLNSIIYGINNVFMLFYVIILIRILISWIPGIDYRKQPWNFIISVSDPYLRIFDRFIPPLRGQNFAIGLSCMVGLIVLQIIQYIVVNAVYYIGRGLL